MRSWLTWLLIVGLVVPVVGCASSSDRDMPAASPATSGPSPIPTARTMTDAHADCFRTGGMWHPDLNYCEYRTPQGAVPLLR